MIAIRVGSAKVFSSVFVLGMAVAIAACSDNGSGVTPPTTASIVVSATNASFAATQGGADPQSQTIQVTNGSTGTLNGLATTITYQAGQPTGWLTATLSSTTAPSTLTLAASTGTLAEGTYTASVAVSSTAATNSPQVVNVTFSVAAPAPPVISLTSSGADFETNIGGLDPQPQTIDVVNSGGGTLGGLAATVTYAAGQPTDWLTVGLSSQFAPCTLSLTPVTGTLGQGTYTATVVIAAPAASNSPQLVSVTFTVLDPWGY